MIKYEYPIRQIGLFWKGPIPANTIAQLFFKNVYKMFSFIVLALPQAWKTFPLVLSSSYMKCGNPQPEHEILFLSRTHLKERKLVKKRKKKMKIWVSSDTLWWREGERSFVTRQQRAASLRFHFLFVALDARPPSHFGVDVIHAGCWRHNATFWY